MKALNNLRYGTPDVLTLDTDAPRPEVGPQDVLIEVFASPITQGDRRLRAADFPGISKVPGRLMMGLFRPKNAVPGMQFAGRVAAIGGEVTRYAVGDDVFGSAPHSAHAEYVCVPETAPMAKLPSNLTHLEASTLSYNGVTALMTLSDIAKLQPGERVLIVGAAGEVGRSAIRLAKHMGAHVTGLSRASDAALMRELGADATLDRASFDVRRHDGEAFDVILDTVGALPFQHSKKALTATGRYLSLHISTRLILQMMLTSRSSRKRAVFVAAFGDHTHLERVRELAEAGVFAPRVQRTFALEDAVSAHTLLEQTRERGTVILTPRQQPAVSLAMAA